MNFIDFIVVFVVVSTAILICFYLRSTYKDNPCGGCRLAKQCKASKKMAKNLLKNYKKCNKKENSDEV